MREMLVYSALKNYIHAKWPDVYIARKEDINRDNVLAIHFRDLTPLRSMLNGRKYNGRTAGIQFVFQATQSDEDFYKNRTFLFCLEEYMNSLQNQYIVTETKYKFNEDDEPVEIDEPTENDKGVLIGIRSTDLVTSVRELEKSPDGRPRFSINIAITYYIGGNKQ